MKFFIADVNAEPMDSVLRESCINTDLLFVDADHATRLEQAMRYGSLMAEGAIIVVHDFPGERGYEVWVTNLQTIGFAYKYHKLATSKNVVSTVGIFERLSSFEVAKEYNCNFSVTCLS